MSSAWLRSAARGRDRVDGQARPCDFPRPAERDSRQVWYGGKIIMARRLAALTAVGIGFFALVAQAQWGLNEADDADEDSIHNVNSEARAELRARLERERLLNDAAAQAIAVAQPRVPAVPEFAGEAPSMELDELSIEENCFEGSVAWRRGDDLVICAALCASDLDCAAPDRCRLLPASPSVDDPILLAEDAAESDSELAELQVEDVPEALEMTGLCDPFWDLESTIEALELE